MLSIYYKIENSGKYVLPENVTEIEKNRFVHSETKENVIAQTEKMSKSKHNGINPDNLVEKFGSDTVKCYVLDNVDPMKNIYYDPRNLVGVIRWRNRMWLLVTNFINAQSGAGHNSRYVQSKKQVSVEKMWMQRNKAVASFENMNCFAVDELRPDKTMRQTQALTNMLKTFDNSHYQNEVFQRCLLDLVIMVAPFMPLVCSEMWSGLCQNVSESLRQNSLYDFEKDVLEQKWPIELKLQEVLSDNK